MFVFFLSRLNVITISWTEKPAKSYCSRIQDYLKNQKTSMRIIITFPMLLLLEMMSNNKHIKLFSRTEGHLWRTDSFRNLHQDQDNQKRLQIFKKLVFILKVLMKAIYLWKSAWRQFIFKKSAWRQFYFWKSAWR